MRAGRPWWLLAYAADLALRVIRWRFLFAKMARISIATFARALLVGYGFNILLRARLGELARIEYIKLRNECRSIAIPTILLERAMDGLLVLCALTIGVFATRPDGSGSPLLAGLIGVGTAMVLVLVMVRSVPGAIIRIRRRSGGGRRGCDCHAGRDLRTRSADLTSACDEPSESDGRGGAGEPGETMRHAC